VTQGRRLIVAAGDNTANYPFQVNRRGDFVRPTPTDHPSVTPDSVLDLCLWYKTDSTLVSPDDIKDGGVLATWPNELVGGAPLTGAAVYRMIGIGRAATWDFPNPTDRFAVPWSDSITLGDPPESVLGFDLLIAAQFLSADCLGAVCADSHTGDDPAFGTGVVSRESATNFRLYRACDSDLGLNVSGYVEFGNKLPYVIELAYDGVDQTGYAYRDGVLRISRNGITPDYGSSMTFSNLESGDSKDKASIRIMEICVYRRKLLDAERDGLVSYLWKRMGRQ
jgi:hypothetical protein